LCRRSVLDVNARPASSVPSSISSEHEGGRSDPGTSRVGDVAHSNVRRCARSMAEQLPPYRRLGRCSDRRAGSDRPAGRHGSSSGGSDSAWPGNAERFARSLALAGTRREARAGTHSGLCCAQRLRQRRELTLSERHSTPGNRGSGGIPRWRGTPRAVDRRPGSGDRFASLRRL
jgi:hypothetical protein